MESERTQNFNDRLNQWVAAQGFWFQLKYSMSGRGLNGAGGYQLLQLGFRLLVFILVLGAGGLIYLLKRTDSEGFRKKLESSLVAETNSKEGKLEGFERLQGKLSITRFAALGNDGAFFTELEARNISSKMGMLDGLLGKWKTGIIGIGRLDIDLRAGTQDSRLAQSLGDVLFKVRPRVDISGIDVEDATVSWGYSELTRGLVKGSHLKVRPLADGWRLQFKGGSFSQNWLKNLEIEELVVVCGEDGILFEKAIFRKGGGSVDMTGLKITGTERPAIEGTMKMQHMALEGMLPTLAETFFQGAISGEFKVTGSTNSLEGVSFQGKAELLEGDEISLRDRIHVLKALKSVDVFNNYRRVNFRSGSFSMKSGGGSLALTRVDLKAEDLLTLSGSMNVRHPTQEELKAALAAKEKAEAEAPEPAPAKVEEDTDFTLKRAAKESQKTSGEHKAPVLDRYDARLEERKFAEEMAARIADSLQYEGEFEITLRKDAFEKAEKLKAQYPPDEKTGRIRLNVPIEGQLGTLTLKQADEISEAGKKR